MAIPKAGSLIVTVSAAVLIQVGLACLFAAEPDPCDHDEAAEGKCPKPDTLIACTQATPANCEDEGTFVLHNQHNGLFGKRVAFYTETETDEDADPVPCLDITPCKLVAGVCKHDFANRHDTEKKPLKTVDC